MKTLAYTTTPPNYIALYEDIRDRKHEPTKTVLVGEEDLVRQRFAIYETSFFSGQLHTMVASPCGHIRDELRSCYGRNKGMEAIKKTIENSQPLGQLVWCPYCGATTPGSFDHYLPAEKFPEYSAHALNLLPCCTRCNSIKDDDWLFQGSRQYLNFYIDSIPAVPFLSVDIISDEEKEAVGANFELLQAGMSDDIWKLIESHFRKLKLIELYDSYSNALINLALRSVHSHMAAGGAHPDQFLASEARQNASLFGEYGWRAVLLRAMASHPDLENWITWL